MATASSFLRSLSFISFFWIQANFLKIKPKHKKSSTSVDQETLNQGQLELFEKNPPKQKNPKFVIWGFCSNSSLEPEKEERFTLTPRKSEKFRRKIIEIRHLTVGDRQENLGIPYASSPSRRRKEEIEKEGDKRDTRSQKHGEGGDASRKAVKHRIAEDLTSNRKEERSRKNLQSSKMNTNEQGMKSYKATLCSKEKLCRSNVNPDQLFSEQHRSEQQPTEKVDSEQCSNEPKQGDFEPFEKLSHEQTVPEQTSFEQMLIFMNNGAPEKPKSEQKIHEQQATSNVASEQCLNEQSPVEENSGTNVTMSSDDGYDPCRCSVISMLE